MLSPVRAFIRLLALGCGVSALAAAAGYLDLAAFLGVGLFYVFFLSFIVLAARVVVEDVLTIGLTHGPLVRLHTVVQHRALIERRARRAMDVLFGALWIWLVLDRFELLQPVRSALQSVLGAELRVGQLDLAVSRVVGFALVVIGVYLGTRLIVTFLEEDVYSRMTLPRGVPYALSTLTRYGLLLVGFLLALGTLGLDLTRITVLLSALGLGIGFGLQQIMNNFVSGLILLFERPVKVGDSIQLGDLGGDVLRIGMRSSTLRTPQGAEVIVPNSKIIEEKVTNWTLSDRRRRIDLDVGVTGDNDPERDHRPAAGGRATRPACERHPRAVGVAHPIRRDVRRLPAPGLDRRCRLDATAQRPRGCAAAGPPRGACPGLRRQGDRIMTGSRPRQHRLGIVREDSVERSRPRHGDEPRTSCDGTRSIADRSCRGLPAVTVLVPTRDRSRYLGEAIDSVLGQTFTDLELFVIDDGSTDDTRGLVCAIDDPRLRYLHQARAESVRR